MQLSLIVTPKSYIRFYKSNTLLYTILNPDTSLKSYILISLFVAFLGFCAVTLQATSVSSFAALLFFSFTTFRTLTPSMK